MTSARSRGWAAPVAFMAASVLLLAGCSSASGGSEADGVASAEPAPALAVAEVPTPAAIDPAAIGWESAQTAVEVAPGLAEDTVDCALDVVAAAREVVGVLCTNATPARTVYSDTATGGAWTTADLLTPDGEALVRDALAEVGADLGEGGPADLRFAADGSLVIPAADGRSWQVSSADAGQILTENGRLVRGSVRSGGGFSAVVNQHPAGVPLVSGAGAQLPPPVASTMGDVDCSVEKCIAITYDDGPGPYTERLLDILAARGAKATFFMLGQLVGGREATVQRMVDEGHEVANHSWSHPDLRTLGADGISSQLTRTQDAITSAVGVTPTAMRPPYGATNETVLNITRDLGLAVIMWDVDTEDWKNRSVSETTSRALSGAHEGAIILFHDIHPSTIDAAPGIIDALQAQGYTLVTVANLLGEDMTPGVRYFSATNP